MAKKTTREMVRDLVRGGQGLNLSRIAEQIGVSRERVRQIVTQEGLVVAKGVVGYCPRTARPPAARVRTGGVPVPLSGSVAGHVAELLAAADLGARGYAVFRPLLSTERCDLITMDRATGEVERIEVRSGTRRNGRIYWRKADGSKSDRRAIVLSGEPVHYEPPYDGDTGPAAPQSIARL